MCNCILCTVGREVYRPSPIPDLAPLKRVIAAIKAYDVKQSPYHFAARDKKEMITYLTKHAIKERVHFSEMEYFFWDRAEEAKWQYPQAK